MVGVNRCRNVASSHPVIRRINASHTTYYFYYYVVSCQDKYPAITRDAIVEALVKTKALIKIEYFIDLLKEKCGQVEAGLDNGFFLN